MFIRIRKEQFGYVLFERYTRDVHFVQTSDDASQYDRDALQKFLSRHYPAIDAHFQHEFMRQSGQTLGLSAPIGMYAEITRRCTLNCGHCYKPDDPGAQLMSLDTWKRLIQELHDLGVFEIRLCGNEPMASPFFRELCEYILGLNLFLSVNTNGYFGSAVQDELVSAKPNFVVVSVDGDEKSHDQIRGAGSYSKAVALLDRLSKTSIRRRINAVVSALTLDTIEHTVKLADKYGTDVSFLPFRPVGRHTAFSATCAINKEQMRQSVEAIMRLRQQYPHLLLLTYFDILGERATYHHSMDCNKPCPARKNGFIAYNGDFYLCDFLRYLGRIYHCGNVATSGFRSVWTSSPTLERFRNLKHDKCNRCEHYMTKCYGGCISGSIASTGCPDDELCFVEIDGTK